MELLNLGCGDRYHPAWTNVDFRSKGGNVIAYDLRKGIPFDSNQYDLVYHSNVIEHFCKTEAPLFLDECHRVLKDGGVLRVAFPDLEQIVLNYIRILKDVRNGKMELEDDYDWIMLELLDQLTRNYSGGEMFKYFIRESIPNEEFVISRCGIEAQNLINNGRSLYRDKISKLESNDVESKHFIRVVISLLRSVRNKVKSRKENKIKRILGEEDYEALKVGRFRFGGEIHQWMYDTYSLSQLLKHCGFQQIIIRDANTSYIENWPEYNLDTEPDGSIYKPDSSYIEAIK